jgi:putative transposase
MILNLQQGLRDEVCDVPLAKLCRWFAVPRRTVYYRAV